jgi:hypothetical protein
MPTSSEWMSNHDHKEDTAGREAPGATDGEKPSKVQSPWTAAARNKAAGQGAEGSVEGARNPEGAAKPGEVSPAARELGASRSSNVVSLHLLVRRRAERLQGGGSTRESAPADRDKITVSDDGDPGKTPDVRARAREEDASYATRHPDDSTARASASEGRGGGIEPMRYEVAGAETLKSA